MPLLSTFRASAPSLSRQIDRIGFVQKKRMGTRRDTRAFSRVELPIIHICTILILPRQARDKHRKSKKTLKNCLVVGVNRKVLAELVGIAATFRLRNARET